MAQFTTGVSGTSATASATNLAVYVLTQLTSGNIALVKMINWGGADTSLVSQFTRWARVNNTANTPTALGYQSSSPGITPNAVCNTYGTVAQDTSTPQKNLLMQSWNSQGGAGVVVLPIGGEWLLTGGALGTAYNQIGCGTFTGSGSQSNTTYGVQWQE